MKPPSRRMAFGTVLGISLLLRLASALLQGDVVQALPGIHDQISYDALARRVATGHGFTFATPWWPLTEAGAPTAHWSYLYTLFLAAVYRLFGPHPLLARLLQAIAAAVLQPWLAWRLGRRLFGERAGVAAAGITAAYAYFAYYAGALMTEAPFLIGVLGTLEIILTLHERATTPAATAGRREGRRDLVLWTALGLIVGLTALLRQLFLLVVPFLAGWLFLSVTHRSPAPTGSGRPRLGRLFAGALLACLCTALVVSPATLYNLARFDRFVLLNTNAGFAFFWGNHPIHGTRFQPILPAGGPSYADLIPPELRELDEASLDRELLRRGLGFVTESPGRYVLLSLSRIPAYFEFWPSSDSSLPSNVARALSFGLCLPLMLWGLRLAWGRRRTMHPGAALLALFAAVYTGIHLATWALIRYRLPVDAALVPFAGLAVDDLIRRAARARGDALLPGPLQASIKRAVDLGLGAVTLVLAAPLIGVIAVAVKIDSPGPILHRRLVLGRDGEPFHALKFRTMVEDGHAVLSRHPRLLEHHRRHTKVPADPRVTRLGRLLRRFSLDELPQLVNVLRGQMSLVGPRMLHPSEEAHYGPSLARALRVRPGMTGLWQVSGRAELDWRDRARLDLEYLESYSLALDVGILLRTPAVVLRGRGAL